MNSGDVIGFLTLAMGAVGVVGVLGRPRRRRGHDGEASGLALQFAGVVLAGAGLLRGSTWLADLLCVTLGLVLASGGLWLILQSPRQPIAATARGHPPALRAN